MEAIKIEIRHSTNKLNIIRIGDKMKYSTQLDRNYILSWLEKLLNTPSPSGYCMTIMTLIQQEMERINLSYEMTPKGNMIVTLHGESHNQTLGLSGHVDTLGAMVRSIKPNGMLRITPIGGYAMQTIEGEYCFIH